MSDYWRGFIFGILCVIVFLIGCNLNHIAHAADCNQEDCMGQFSIRPKKIADYGTQVVKVERYDVSLLQNDESVLVSRGVASNLTKKRLMESPIGLNSQVMAHHSLPAQASPTVIIHSWLESD